MSKRIQITLPDEVYYDLVRWAESMGRPLANLTGWIVEKEVGQAKETGEIPHPTEEEKSMKQICDRFNITPEELVRAISQIKSESDSYGMCQ